MTFEDSNYDAEITVVSSVNAGLDEVTTPTAAPTKAKKAPVKSAPKAAKLGEGETGSASSSDDDGSGLSLAPAKKKRRWYIVHTYSGHENKVKVNLERRIESMNMADKIFRVEVPQKAVTKIKDGKRVEKEERIFPGYVLVEMIMEDDSWYVVRHTPGVTKFVGGEKKPIPARDAEIKRILLKGAPAPAKVEIDLKVGQNIKIISGPFADFEGTVTEVNAEKEKVKATVSIFGRETPVDLPISWVQKA
jgi:transcription termination/antitermination protein NusG